MGTWKGSITPLKKLKGGSTTALFHWKDGFDNGLNLESFMLLSKLRKSRPFHALNLS